MFSDVLVGFTIVSWVVCAGIILWVCVGEFRRSYRLRRERQQIRRLERMVYGDE